MVAASIVLAPLHPESDLRAVEAVYRRASDYLALESGLTPDAAARAFFEERPPTGDDAPLKFGVADDTGGLVAIGDLAFGYPEPTDACLGLLLLVPTVRGEGLGQAILGEVKRLASARGALRLLLGVLDANERARAFWERQGFKLNRTSGPHAFGKRHHLVHRLELPLGGNA
ncbi:GNAT family N-acetyltransferase [Pleomorphomonas diazotrophica]|uniref:GNAT family N-acetyltransferase n=1 Tax=Pleomorphomonas diazotrophica TaxID=1166257 RepID=A0A1I4SCT0_9HYPH|nr:GNAT family N-acetyltransferase [Pleomorphomonas diazotrophica]PKR88850.1 GNAT family N-acetyltransferase [Pleomorphomonas diazotrophica]SFM62120.1 Protein N-acetyltransferase, RimJ/RimL family [Pleomorphomonas diazotrophica]